MRHEAGFLLIYLFILFTIVITKGLHDISFMDEELQKENIKNNVVGKFLED